MRRRSLLAHLIEFFARGLSHLSRVRSFVALAVVLARDQPAYFLSFAVLAAKNLHDRGCNVATRASEATERTAGRTKGEESRKDAGRPEEEASGWFSGKLVPIAVFSWER